MEQPTNNDDKTVGVPIFITQADIEKMIYIIYNQDLPDIKNKLEELSKLASKE